MPSRSGRVGRCRALRKATTGSGPARAGSSPLAASRRSAHADVIPFHVLAARLLLGIYLLRLRLHVLCAAEVNKDVLKTRGSRGNNSQCQEEVPWRGRE